MNNSAHFNWREYIVIHPDYRSEYLDDNGEWKNKEIATHTQEYILNEIAKLDKISSVLDQISLIPHVQTLIRQGHALGVQRLKDTAEEFSEPVREDTRIRVTSRAGGSLLGGSQGASYDYFNNVLGVELQSLINFQIRQQNGSYSNSLQSAIIHELGHAADPNLTLEAEKKDRADAANIALTQLLSDFPEYHEEFETTGTIQGFEVRRLLSPTGINQFDNAYKAILGGSSILLIEDNLKEAVEMFHNSTYSTPEQNRREQISTYFENAYQRAYNRLTAERYEHPVIASTNIIAAEHLGLVPYVLDYGNSAQELPRDQQCREDFESPKYTDLEACIEKIDTPIISPPAILAQTLQCHGEAFFQGSCQEMAVGNVENAEICSTSPPKGENICRGR